MFTKSPVLSSVGWGDWIGVRSESQWNNPEPEIVLACDARGRMLGAALGNDVNLRDIEGRSALLLGKAKDNNASCAIGPFIRLFDERFSLDDVRSAVVALKCKAPTDYRLEGSSSMSLISRDPLDLVEQTLTSISIRTASCCSWARCSRRRRIATRPGAASLTRSGDVVRVSVAGARDAREQGDDVAAGAAVDAGNRRADAQPGAAAGCCPVRRRIDDMSHTVYPSLRNKRVVVTGGGSSIGAAIVERFAQQGARVAFLDIAEAESRELERRLADSPTPPRYYPCDLTDIAAIRELFPRIRSQLGPIDVLINNAANDDRHNVEEVDAGLLGRAHCRQSAPLLLLRAGRHRRHEGGSAPAPSSISARCRGTWRCRTSRSIRPPKPASKA